jgi:hypothetical protein
MMSEDTDQWTSTARKPRILMTLYQIAEHNLSMVSPRMTIKLNSKKI